MRYYEIGGSFFRDFLHHPPLHYCHHSQLQNFLLNQIAMASDNPHGQTSFFRSITIPGVSSGSQSSVKNISTLFCNAEAQARDPETPTFTAQHDDYKASGSVIAAVPVDNSQRIRLIYYNCRSKSDSDSDSNSDSDSRRGVDELSFEYVRSKFLTLPTQIEAQVLLNTPSLNIDVNVDDEYNRTVHGPIPILLVLGKDGKLYTSVDDLLRTNGKISMVECKKVMTKFIRRAGQVNSTSMSSSSQENHQHFLGMDLLSGAVHGQQMKQVRNRNIHTKMAKEPSILIVAGTQTLFAPMIVVLYPNASINIIEIRGLENTMSPISAVKIVNQQALDIHTRRGLRCKAAQFLESNCENSVISVALVGLNDGTVYAVYVSCTHNHQGKRDIDVSQATILYEPCKSSLFEKIVCFCVVPTSLSKSVTGAQSQCFEVICVLSLGSILPLNDCFSERHPTCSAIIPKLSLGCMNTSASRLGVINHAEPLPMGKRSENSGALLTFSSTSIIASTNNGSTYIIRLKRSARNHDEDVCSADYLETPLRKDVALISTCFPTVPPMGSNIDVILVGMTFRKSLHLFVPYGFTSDNAKDKSTHNRREQMHVPGYQTSSSIDDMLKQLSEFSADSGREEEDDIALKSTRYALDLVSPLLPSNRSTIDDPPVTYQLDPTDPNVLNVSTDFNIAEKKSDSSVLECRTTHIYQSVAMSSDAHPPSIADLKKLGSRRVGNQDIPIIHGGLAQSHSVSIPNGNCQINNSWKALVWNPNEHTMFTSSTISYKDDKKRSHVESDHSLHSGLQSKREKYSGFNQSKSCVSIQRGSSSQPFYPVSLANLLPIPSTTLNNDIDIKEQLKSFAINFEMPSQFREELTLQNHCTQIKNSGTGMHSIKLLLPQSILEKLELENSVCGCFLKGYCTFTITDSSDDSNMKSIDIVGRAHNIEDATKISLVGEAYLRRYILLSLETTVEDKGTSFILNRIKKSFTDTRRKKSIKYLKKIKSKLDGEDCGIDSYLDLYKKIRSCRFL